MAVPDSEVYDCARLLKSDVPVRKAKVKQDTVNTAQFIQFSVLHPAKRR